MKEKLIGRFIYSAGAILLAAALIRFVIAAGNAQALSLPEPMLGIPLRYSMLLVGGFELTVALICLFGRQLHFQVGWLAWLATNFIVFQIGLFWMHIHPQATCIGSFTDPLRLARGVTGFITSLFPFYLLLGSYAAVIWPLFEGRKQIIPLVTTMPVPVARSQEVLVRFIKIACIACGGHIEFPSNLFGQKIPCPHCQAAITLQKPGNIKMSCTDCDGHIEFPAHAVGQEIPCPHCNTNITLKEPA
jgi:DNA-directed RNA polymerase subunit RPC12/RpoP